MKKQLFFDDRLLFENENTVRLYGNIERIATYSDPNVSTDFSTGFVFRLDDGTYRMLYLGHGSNFEGHKLFSAVSDDGITFSPEILYPEKEIPNVIMDCAGEIGTIYEDEYCDDKNERYKMLMAPVEWDKLLVDNQILVSSDLLSWNLKDGAKWGDGAEPLVSVFYNKHKKVHTVVGRPDWGIRCAGYMETTDFKEYSEYRYCLNIDAQDEKLAELYGMYAFEYDGMYIGFPHLYRGIKGALNTKYTGGTIDTELAYSYDGRYWLRSIRKPFVSGVNGINGIKYPLVWVSCVKKLDDGNIYIYASSSELEHGPAFNTPGTGKIHIFKIRNDGFISLSTENKDIPSVIATREKVWHGGELHLNLKAKKATISVNLTEDGDVASTNLLSFSKPLEGYTHEDCIPFSGDETDWIPKFKNGKTLDMLKGQSLVFELKFEDGEVYSISGNYTDIYNVPAARYRKFGVLPN